MSSTIPDQTWPGTGGTSFSSLNRHERLVMATEINRHHADEDHDVVSLAGDGRRTHRRTPCESCPWVVENAGDFPAAAFLLSAETAEDMSTHTFACHESGAQRPATCAGFLLRGADHNLAVRLSRSEGAYLAVDEDGRELFEDYFEMAVANGCDPQAPELLRTRRAPNRRTSERSRHA